jgi:erythromycin esterase-like protein
VLDGFERWPTWMWANEEVVACAEWLRGLNAGRPGHDRVGFYGLDVYSLWDSMRALINYLRVHEPEHVQQAVRAYRCFEPYREDPQRYAMAPRFSPMSGEAQVVGLLTDQQPVQRVGHVRVPHVLVGAGSHRGSVVVAEGCSSSRPQRVSGRGGWPSRRRSPRGCRR